MANIDSSKIISDSFVAAETIPVFAAVSLTETSEIKNTDWPDVTSVSNFLGISTNAGFAGQNIEVCLFGIITNPSWSFTPQRPVYLHYTGTLTQTNPIRSMRKIGKALTPTKLFINPSDILLLNK